MKTSIHTITLCLLALIGSYGSVNAEEKKQKIEVKMVSIDPKDPDKWEATLPSVPIMTYSVLQEVKSASYQKKQARTAAAYQRKQGELARIYCETRREQNTALQKLKAVDPEAAFYWLECEVFIGTIPLELEKKEPESPAYRQFLDTLRGIEKKNRPEDKGIEATYAKATRRADEIYQAEVDKADELYDEQKVK